MKIDKTRRDGRQYIHWVLLLTLFGLIAIVPAEGRLAYTRSENTQAPNYEEIDSDAVRPPAEANAAHDHTTHAHLQLGHIPDDGRFTTSAEPENWPPQYKAVENVTWHQSVTDSLSDRELSNRRAYQGVAKNTDIQVALGERFAFISAVPIEKKWESEITGHTITWFSYSNNVTVEAVVQDEQVTAIQTYEAADYQPPLRQNEVDEAITIARQYWTDQGNERIDTLLGYAIQTLQTEGEGGYYDTRMTYVSFHADLTSEPQLLTWVDLTNQTVVRGVVDTGVSSD